MSSQRYRDRQDAGQALAAELKQVLFPSEADGQVPPDDANRWADSDQVPLILALPRGGVPVAAEVAEELRADLDVLVVRKVGVPSHPELAMGALAMLGGTVETVRNETVLAQLPGTGDPGAAFDSVAETERQELIRREETFRQGRPPIDLTGRTVIIVDDGLATGSTMKAALIAARRLSPARLVAAVPVGARQICADLEDFADDVVNAWMTDDLGSVGAAYEVFTQTSSEEVAATLQKHWN